ncbi:hypothetical protein K439DRAFT_1630336 [Ramaria rubella]|nr:hypothetical protein K439DRAFT_1630336 [Ramaria rubella]
MIESLPLSQETISDHSKVFLFSRMLTLGNHVGLIVISCSYIEVTDDYVPLLLELPRVI